MATQTPNYGLHQWEPSDNFLRTDFNTDFQKIDTALGEMATQSQLEETDSVAKSKCRVVIGSYTGNGATSRVINLGFRPKVLAVDNTSFFSSGYELALDGIDRSYVKVVDGGFQVYNGSLEMNENGTVYRYYAFV